VPDLGLVDHGAALQVQNDKLVGRLGRRGQRHADPVASGGDARPAELKPTRGAAQRDLDVAVESILAQSVHADGHGAARGHVDAGGCDAEREIRTGRSHAQPVAVRRSTLSLRIGQLHEVLAVGEELEAEIRIGAVREQPRVHVEHAVHLLVVIVPGEHASRRVGQAQQGVQRRIQPAGLHFRDHLVTRAALESKHVDVARWRNAPVQDARQGDQLRLRRRIVRFGLRAGRELVHGVGQAVGGAPARAPVFVLRTLGVRLRVQVQPIGRQVPAVNRDVAFVPGARAQREHGRDERVCAYADAINKVRASAIERVADFDLVLAVGGDFIAQHRVGIEAVVVREGNFVTLRVVQCNRGLEPARNGVGQVGDQPPGGRRDDELLSRLCVEAEAVDVAGHDLTVEDDRQRERRLRRQNRGRAGVVALQFDCLRRGPHFKDHRVGQALAPAQPQLAVTQRGVAVDRDLEQHRLGELRVELSLAQVDHGVPDVQ